MAAGVCLVLVAGNVGCWLPYALSVAAGELRVVICSRPIEDVLADGDLDAETRAKLERVLDIRRYAIDVLGLDGGDSYSVFYDSGDEDVLFSVSASRKDRFEPRVWTFPIFGRFEFINFFHEDQAWRCTESLADDGWDVFLYAPRGYSTLGWFTDPLFSAALVSDEIDLADLVIHEFTHNTIYANSSTVFNESVATFVGRTGTLLYLADRHGEDSELLAAARARWADVDLYNQFWIDLYDALNAFYDRQDLSSQEKIAQREGVIAEQLQRFADETLPAMSDPDRYGGLLTVEINNAYVLINRRYNLDLDLFQAVYDALGQDLSAAIQIFAASDRSDDPKQYLRDWLANR